MATGEDASEPKPQKNFFISYNRADRTWAEWTAWQLEEAGYTTVLQAWDFRPGGNFVLDMQRAAAEAERTLAMLSEDFLASAFTQPEWAAAFVQDPTGEKGILVPVRVRDCNPLGLLRSITYIDLVDASDEAAARDVLLAGLQMGRRKPALAPAFPRGTSAPRSVSDRPRFPGALPRIWHVPHIRNLNFSGREELLVELRKALSSGQPAALTQAITGLGGVGKTQLATEYAYRHANSYDIVWWLVAEEPATLASKYAELARELALPENDETNQAMRVAAVRRWLRQQPGWLLVFDNVNEPAALDGYLPQSATGHVLITSRNPNWQETALPFSIQVLAKEDAIALLLKLTGQTDEAAAGRLAELLGHLPLALAQAGAYMHATHRSLSSYVELFKTRWPELLGRNTVSKHYPWTVATTWQLAFQQVQQASPAAVDLLNLCAFLGPDNIPRQVLSDGAENVPRALGAALTDPLAFDDAVLCLQQYSLIGVMESALSIHRLVQAVTRDRLQEEARRTWAEAAVRLLNAAFNYDSNDVTTWPVCAELLPHALVTAGHVETLHLADEPTGHLLNRVGLYLWALAHFREAQTVLERALAIYEKARGPDHPDTAATLNSLGSLLRVQDDPVGARPYHERALAIYEKARGPDHPDIAATLNDIGTLLHAQGDPASARPYHERALAIYEKARGPDHPRTAATLNNLGSLLQAQGDPAGARPYHERALAIYEKALGPDHPDTAATLNNLGTLLQAQGALADARPYLERALAICERMLGPDHPDTATSLNNLGSLLQAQGDLAAARPYLERALTIVRVRLGEQDSTPAFLRNYLGVRQRFLHF
jgi:tetratricopeptide (TPR) repeat protein